MTEEEWEALSTEEKRGYALVALQQATSGYNRGILVSGADYVPLGLYLPYSNIDTVLCEAIASEYSSASMSWGNGSKPVTLTSGGLTVNEDGAVVIPTKTLGVLGYVDLGATDTAYTAYIVGKLLVSSGSYYTRLISNVHTMGTNQAAMLYGSSNITVSTWANDSGISDVYSTRYFAGAISASYAGAKMYGIAINASDQQVNAIEKTVINTGRYITIGRSNIGTSAANQEPSDMAVKYIGVTNVLEDPAVILNNLRYLASQFIEG